MTDELSEVEPNTMFIFVGGPFHGFSKTVEDRDTVLTLMPLPQMLRPGDIATPEIYVKRSIEASPRGPGFRQELYVHNSIKNPNELPALLANALLVNFLEAGEEVESEPAEATSSLLLPGQ